jgi:hypothetical protein
LQLPALDTTGKPDTDRKTIRIVKVGVDGDDLPNIHLEAGLFLKLPSCRLAHLFSPFHIAAGNTPFSSIRPPDPTAQKNLIPLEDNNRYPHSGINIDDTAAIATDQPWVSVAQLLVQRLTATGAKTKGCWRTRHK